VLSGYLWRKHYTNTAPQEIDSKQDENLVIEEEKELDQNYSQVNDQIISSFGEKIPQFCYGGYKFLNEISSGGTYHFS
jgi:hypothetical protein